MNILFLDDDYNYRVLLADNLGATEDDGQITSLGLQTEAANIQIYAPFNITQANRGLAEVKQAPADWIIMVSNDFKVANVRTLLQEAQISAYEIKIINISPDEKPVTQGEVSLPKGVTRISMQDVVAEILSDGSDSRERDRLKG